MIPVNKVRLLLRSIVLTMSILWFGLGSAGCTAFNSATPTPIPTIDLAAVDRGAKQVVAEGEVVPGQYVILTFPYGGIIEQVLVREGDLVSTGELLARLKGRENLESGVAAAGLGLLMAQQAMDDLYENAPLRKAQAELALAQAQKACHDAQKRRDELDYPVGDGNRIDLALVDYLLAQNRVEDAERAFEGVSHLPLDDKERAEKLYALGQARVQRDRTLLTYNYLVSIPGPLAVGVSEGELQIAKANLDKANTDWQRLKDGIDADELALVESRLQAAKTQLAAAQSALRDIELRAPFDGIVVTNTIKVGELASPMAFISMADSSSWKVETTDLTELDIISIDLGTPAKISVDALPGEDFYGEVESIQTIGVERRNDITYRITLNLQNGDDRLRWNMTAFMIFDVN